MTGSQTAHFFINISADEFRAYYRGDIKYVITRAKDGRKIQFPAEVLRPFLDQHGVRGNFVITFDRDHKFVEIQRLPVD